MKKIFKEIYSYGEWRIRTEDMEISGNIFGIILMLFLFIGIYKLILFVMAV